MATALFGTLQEFQPENDSITASLERAELFFKANDIADLKKVTVLLSVIGARSYALLCSLVAPELPQDKSLEDLQSLLKRQDKSLEDLLKQDKSLEDLQSLLKRHFEPKPLIIAERFHFNRRNQTETESVNEYAAKLRRLATSCEFGEFLNEALRDRFVCGLRNENTQNAFFQ